MDIKIIAIIVLSLTTIWGVSRDSEEILPEGDFKHYVDSLDNVIKLQEKRIDSLKTRAVTAEDNFVNAMDEVNRLTNKEVKSEDLNKLTKTQRDSTINAAINRLRSRRNNRN